MGVLSCWGCPLVGGALYFSWGWSVLLYALFSLFEDALCSSWGVQCSNWRCSVLLVGRALSFQPTTRLWTQLFCLGGSTFWCSHGGHWAHLDRLLLCGSCDPGAFPRSYPMGTLRQCALCLCLPCSWLEFPFPDDTFLPWTVPWGQQVPVLTLGFLLLVQPQLDEEPRVVACVHPAKPLSPVFSRILPPQ